MPPRVEAVLLCSQATPGADPLMGFELLRPVLRVVADEFPFTFGPAWIFVALADFYEPTTFAVNVRLEQPGQEQDVYYAVLDTHVPPPGGLIFDSLHIPNLVLPLPGVYAFRVMHAKALLGRCTLSVWPGETT